MRVLYCLLAYLLLPLYAGVMLWRGFGDRGWWQRFAERFGFGARSGEVPPIWVHAVSVGEVQVAAALVNSLGARFPGRPLLLTTVTATGAARARALFGERVQVRFLPFDLPGAVRRFLARARPQVAIVLETELWPNLFHACGVRGVPLVLASARLSERSVRRYRRLPALVRPALARAALVLAQTRADAERFIALGAAPERTRVNGSLKFDLALPDDVEVRGARLRARLAPGRPLWIAGSTHAGEEAVLLAAHRRLRAARPDALLVLAPRHPQRFAEVAAWLEGEAVKFVRRSSEPSGGARDTRDADIDGGVDAEVLLLDTLGELMTFYAAGDVAFVGGSLVPVGGHNLLEPAALGLPILSGPHHFNAPEVARELAAHGALQLVADAPTLATALEALLGDAAERARRGAEGRTVLERNRGALARLLTLLEPYLSGSASTDPASR